MVGLVLYPFLILFWRRRVQFSLRTLFLACLFIGMAWSAYLMFQVWVRKTRERDAWEQGIRYLGSADASERYNAFAALSRCSPRKSIPKLVLLLNDEDQTLRWLAANKIYQVSGCHLKSSVVKYQSDGTGMVDHPRNAPGFDEFVVSLSSWLKKEGWLNMTNSGEQDHSLED